MQYLCSYRPIIRTKQGRQAQENYNFPGYVDGSCRREPNFQNPYPSITALCRFTRFAPRLHTGDKIVYETIKGRYPGHSDGHWRLTAILQVKRRFESHSEAADWYRSHNIQLPKNCMIKGNPPLEFDQTDGKIPSKLKSRRDRLSDEQIVRLWDAGYQDRADKCGIFLSCEAQYLNLQNPPILRRSDKLEIFGRVPGTQNPPQISLPQFEKLENIIYRWEN